MFSILNSELTRQRRLDAKETRFDVGRFKNESVLFPLNPSIFLRIINSRSSRVAMSKILSELARTVQQSAMIS